MTTADFSDILAANTSYVDHFRLRGLRPQAARGLAVLTCIDSRIEPLQMLGLVPGDAKILRNAGGRMTPDAIRSLVLAIHLLDVRRVAVIGHTQCKMTEATNDELRAEIAALAGTSTDGWDFEPIADHHATLVDDIQRLRDCPLVPASVVIAALIYDVDSGRIGLEATV